MQSECGPILLYCMWLILLLVSILVRLHTKDKTTGHGLVDRGLDKIKILSHGAVPLYIKNKESDKGILQSIHLYAH